MDEEPIPNGKIEEALVGLTQFINVDDETLNNFSLNNKEIVDMLVDILLAKANVKPCRISKIKDMKYDFSPLTVVDKKKGEDDVYETYVDCVDINGFLYPTSIFTGKIDYSFSDNSIKFYLKDEYRNISDIYGGIEMHSADYFSHGKVPSFIDFVVRKRIVIAPQKDLKIVVANCQGHGFINEGLDLEHDIVDLSEEMLPGVSIEVHDQSVGRSFLFHYVKIDFNKNIIEYTKKYLVKEPGNVWPVYYVFSFSFDLSMLPKVIPFCKEYPMSDLTPMFLSKNFCKMFAVDWNGIVLKKLREYKQLEKIGVNTKAIKKDEEFEYDMFIDNGDDSTKWRTSARFTSEELNKYSPLGDGGGAFINQLMLLRQDKKTIIDILNKYGIAYKDERERPPKHD